MRARAARVFLPGNFFRDIILLLVYAQLLNILTAGSEENHLMMTHPNAHCNAINFFFRVKFQRWH